MKRIIKLVTLGSLSVFFLVFLILCFNVIKTDIQYAHQSFATHQNPFDWLTYKVKTKIVKSLVKTRKDNVIGLPAKRLYIKKNFQKEFFSNIPSSTKIWKDGFLLNDDGSNDKIKIRLRGDNPTNWLF